MFTIHQNTFQTSTPDRAAERTGNIPPITDSDATQRVSVGSHSVPFPPQRRTPAKSASRRQAPVSRKPSMGKQKEKILIFILLGVAAILLIGAIVAASFLFSKPNDDGLIPNNVFAAGVNLGGMTEDEAKQALTDATKDTYSKLDMTVQVLDTVVTMSPQEDRKSVV